MAGIEDDVPRRARSQMAVVGAPSVARFLLAYARHGAVRPARRLYSAVWESPRGVLEANVLHGPQGRGAAGELTAATGQGTVQPRQTGMSTRLLLAALLFLLS